MADGNITVEVSTQAATAELRRLRVENAALKREAHAWWTVARDVMVAERERCAQRVVLQPKRTPLTEFERMRIIGDEFPIALVQQAVIAKVDAVCRAIERAHGIGA